MKRNEATTPAFLPPSQAADQSIGDESGCVRWCLWQLGSQGRREHRVPVSGDRLSVGRRPENQLCVAHPTVSGNHAMLFMVADDLFIKDLNSTNGTLLNGRRITAPELLRDGDALHFGQVQFCVEEVAPVEDIDLSDFCRQTFAASIQSEGVLQVAFDQLISRAAITPYFQPVVRLQDRHCLGYEVLARSELAGLETPARMFDVAAQRLSEGKLSELCRSQGLLSARRLDAGKAYYVNTHPSELGTPRLLKSLESLRESFPELEIVLEVHESAMTSLGYLTELVDHLRDLKMKLAYDDFGVGQARIVELFKIPPDVLKFDLKFVQGIESSTPQQLTSLRSLLRVVSDMQVETLAEGIETETQLEICRDLGFELGQGYGLGRPNPLSHWQEQNGLPGDTAQFSKDGNRIAIVPSTGSATTPSPYRR